MPSARRIIIDESVPQVFHCVSRCVPQAVLTGVDPVSGKRKSHRKKWIREHLEKLQGAFAIDVFSFAVTPRELHVLLRTNPKAARRWSRREVAERWLALFPPQYQPRYVERDEIMAKAVAKLAKDKERVELLRQRLASVSWFMRCLNEKVARRMNKEDGVRGQVWKRRFICCRLDL